MDLKKFGKNFKEIRLNKKISTAKLSELTGISESMLRYYERGEYNPTIVNIVAISKALDTKISILIEEEVSQEDKQSYIDYVTQKKGLEGMFLDLKKLSSEELLRLEDDVEFALKLIREKYKL